MAKHSEAKLKADRKYISKFAQLRVLVDPEDKELWLSHIDKTGESMAQFIRRAVSEQVKRDNEKDGIM